MDQEEATRLVNTVFESSAIFLVQYAFRRTRSIEIAEDLVQEAFLALYRDLRLGKSIQDPRGWIIGAVRNQACKYARSCARHGEELVPTEKLDLIPSQQPANVGAEETDAAPLLLSILTPREEEVVLLRLQSFKYREIADQLGIGTKSVCTLLTRAIKKLRAVTQIGRPAEGSRSGGEVSSALH